MESQIKKSEYSSENYPDQDLTYKLIGIGMDVHRYLGNGFLEILSKDALEEEFKRQGIFYEHEKKFEVEYKGIILPHFYHADFVVEKNIILEAKAQEGIHEEVVPQVINYLAASKLKLGLVLNFGEASLRFKRVIFSRKGKPA